MLMGQSTNLMCLSTWGLLSNLNVACHATIYFGDCYERIINSCRLRVRSMCYSVGCCGVYFVGYWYETPIATALAVWFCMNMQRYFYLPTTPRSSMKVPNDKA